MHWQFVTARVLRSSHNRFETDSSDSEWPKPYLGCFNRPQNTTSHTLLFKSSYWTILFPCACLFRLANLRIKLKDQGNLGKVGTNRSFVWNYFGSTTDISGKRVAEDQLFCSVCFEKGVLKGYKETVSTTNLAAHLREAHGILCSILYLFSLYNCSVSEGPPKRSVNCSIMLPVPLLACHLLLFFLRSDCE